MKKYLAAFLTLFIFNAHANLDTSQPTAQTNTSQQTGGNYIYAENGKLTFNLEPSLFEN